MDIEELQEKYKAGKTTLKEEQLLFQNKANSDSELSAWYKYVQRSKKQASPDLKEKIWNAIQKKTIRLKLAVFTAAASILLLAVFSLHPTKETQLSNHEKEMKLQEAMALITDFEAKQPVESIIYEDEMVIIYTSKEQNK